jgi:predicted nucleic acid-binding Zn ribbon protein
MDLAGRLIPKMNLPPELAEQETRARAAWPKAIGKKIARHTRAAMLVRSTLVVEVEDYVWQRQLSTLRPQLLKNLERELGERIVTEIDFRPMPRRREAQRAESARPNSIGDPVLSLLYERSRRNSA